MTKQEMIEQLADLAVRRGDYRRGSKNYAAYLATLEALSETDLADRLRTETEHDAELEQLRKSAKNRQPESDVNWKKENSKVIAVRLMTKGDADILAAIEGKQAAQELRRLIRLGIEADKNK